MRRLRRLEGGAREIPADAPDVLLEQLAVADPVVWMDVWPSTLEELWQSGFSKAETLLTGAALCEALTGTPASYSECTEALNTLVDEIWGVAP